MKIPIAAAEAPRKSNINPKLLLIFQKA